MADCFLMKSGSIDTSITYGENLFNYEEFKNAIKNIMGGTVEWDDNVKGFTLISNSNDCYTDISSSPKYSIEHQKTYELSYETEKSSEDVKANGLMFFNGSTDLENQVFFSVDNKRIIFTPTLATTYTTIRFGVRYSGNSIKYSNIQLREILSLG